MSRARTTARAMAGYTLLETMIVVALMGGMSLLLNQALKSTHNTDGYLEAVARANQTGETMTFSVATLVGESRHIFQNDERGLGYLAACRLAHPVAPGARMPMKDARNDMFPDEADDPRTGNMLLLVREINASPCVADADTGAQRFIDTYRMIAVYPSLMPRSLLRGQSTSRDLVVWRSVAIPSYRQLISVGDKDERESIVKDLVARYGYTHAWDPRSLASVAFYELGSDGKIEDEPDDKFKLAEDEVLSRGSRLVSRRVQLAATSGPEALRRSRLTADDPDTWTPDGLEVKVCGPSGSRKIWIHMVVESPSRNGDASALYSTTTIAHARDF